MITKDTSPQEALKLALDREKSAREFYTRASELVQDKGTSKLFKELAREEEGHVRRLENEYDRFVMPEN